MSYGSEWGLIDEEPFAVVFDSSVGRRWKVHRIAGCKDWVVLLSRHKAMGYLQLRIRAVELSQWRSTRKFVEVPVAEKAARIVAMRA